LAYTRNHCLLLHPALQSFVFHHHITAFVIPLLSMPRRGAKISYHYNPVFQTIIGGGLKCKSNTALTKRFFFSKA
jgi:hypothetical protein